MLKSDRLYLARFAVDPELENQLDDIEFYMDAEFEEPTEDMAFDFLADNQRETWWSRSTENQTVKRPHIGGKRRRR